MTTTLKSLIKVKLQIAHRKVNSRKIANLNIIATQANMTLP
jgi:hypothetical protein